MTISFKVVCNIWVSVISSDRYFTLSPHNFSTFAFYPSTLLPCTFKVYKKKKCSTFCSLPLSIHVFALIKIYRNKYIHVVSAYRFFVRNSVCFRFRWHVLVCFWTLVFVWYITQFIAREQIKSTILHYKLGYKLVNFYITHFMIHKLHTSFHDSQITLCRNMFSPSGCSKCVRWIYTATRVTSVCTFKWAKKWQKLHPAIRCKIAPLR